MRTVKKITPESDGWYLDEDDEADEQTLERRVRVGSPEPSLFANHLTKRVETLDERLLAIARGEIEPAESSSPSAASMELDDPFGGLVPVPDAEDWIEADESWLDPDVERELLSSPPSRPPET